MIYLPEFIFENGSHSFGLSYINKLACENDVEILKKRGKLLGLKEVKIHILENIDEVNKLKKKIEI